MIWPPENMEEARKEVGIKVDLPLLEARGLTKYFEGLAALVNFEFAIGEREIVSLIGPNGAGKTTFFNVLAGELGPTKGDLRFQGKSIAGLKPEQIAKLGIARTFQNIRLFKGMTGAENVRVALGCRSEYSLFESFLGCSKVRNQEGRGRGEILDLLDFVGLVNVHAELAANLPYGSQRRLELARALALRPNLLLLDEPTAGMNPHETAELMELIKKIRDRQTAIIVIEHDMKVVMGISERVVVLNYGQKIAQGSYEQIRNDSQVIEAYLGSESDYA
jgi:branched-chain amino acid transport system ATP-binding protein